MTVSDRNAIPLDPSRPVRVTQTVDKSGRDIRRRIEGVTVRPLVTHPDGRGSLTELYDLRWDFHPLPLVYSYFVTIRPNQVKGWIRHAKQDDRIAFLHGSIQVVLFDGRGDSPTCGLVNEFCFGTVNRSLVSIPVGVWHALRNVDVHDSFFVNFPSCSYDHDDPDKELLPLDNEIVPYRFR